MSDNKSFMKAWQVDRPYLTSGHLKIIACGAMFLSHLAQCGLLYMLEFTKIADLFMLIGRISMPLFCFMAVQGILLSKNPKKYLSGLLIFAFLSEIPFDLASTGYYFFIYSQNVFFSLFLGAFMVYQWEKIRKSELNELLKFCFAIIIFLGIYFLAGFFMTDYDSNSIVAIGLLYLAKDSRILTALAILVGFAFEARIGGDYLSIPYMVYLSIPLIFLYNGKRGTYNKWYFYAFYPVHLILIYLLKIILL